MACDSTARGEFRKSGAEPTYKNVFLLLQRSHVECMMSECTSFQTKIKSTLVEKKKKDTSKSSLSSENHKYT